MFAKCDQARIFFKALVAQCFAVRRQTFRGVAAAPRFTRDKRDAPMPVLPEMVERLANAARVVHGDERSRLFGCGQDDGVTRTDQILYILKLHIGEIVRNDNQPIGIPWSDWESPRLRPTPPKRFGLRADSRADQCHS
jgi:hypothetical protein